MSSTSMQKRKLRVCVIGAGAAGLCSLRHLATDTTTFEINAYEQTDHIGGTWVYNENVGPDVHSSMYANLRTNLPSEIMNFPDWRKMGGGKRSCVTHAEVLSYLEDYANHFDLRKYITFTAKIDSVKPGERSGPPPSTTWPFGSNIWKVRIQNSINQIIEEKEFDAVICANGHFFEPNVPYIPGIRTFTGQVLHSHDYRRPDSFVGKNVVLLGASSSGADIGIELSGHANHVYLSHNTPRIVSVLPTNITQVMGITGVEGNRFIFKDGTSILADTLIYCTGYRYSFPFLNDKCKITVDDNYVQPLYRHLINAEYPTMCFIGIPAAVVPFPMFHIQVQYFVAVMKQTVLLPSKEIMLEDSVYKTPTRRHAHRLAESQWEYNDALAIDGGFDPLPPMYRAGYTAWKVQRGRNLLHYKEAKFIVADDGESVQIILNDNNASN